MSSPSRMRFTPRTIPLLLLDAFGMVLFGMGLLYLGNTTALFGGFPFSVPTAVLCLLLGVAMMAFAVSGILRALRQPRPSNVAAPGEAE